MNELWFVKVEAYDIEGVLYVMYQAVFDSTDAAQSAYADLLKIELQDESIEVVWQKTFYGFLSGMIPDRHCDYRWKCSIERITINEWGL